ncbi:hypothetical protein MGYG_02430 [Nannizzia gypsea CBS 118893]|uniref:Uncharacterized protein n=1 Tax=Arthroderma gypseum (strain ATCC MYA-4604 / CBS 118893) TaxID=535722 RepID=E4URJ8_ARTGP|nr:hypothetical protein MGYG_02430 [Nannizzia gypsea CBS 118893]EFQ99420.1 hypothetical protein MGYG_02430 [Nannizzia gypsea CBS 118893]
MVGVRRANLSEDSGYMSSTSDDKSLTIEEWASQKDRFRVVAFGTPMLYPVIIRNSPPDLQRIFDAKVKPEIARILAEYNVPFSLSRLDDWRENDCDSPRHTILIESNDENTANWQAASRYVLSIFKQALPLEFAGQTQVEIHNKHRMYSDVSRVLPNDPLLLHDMRSIRPSVSKIVHTRMAGMSSIAYHLRAPLGSNLDETLWKPTIVVFCYPGTSCDFKTAEAEIIQVLEKVPSRIHVEFLPGQVHLSQPNGLPIYLSGLPGYPQNGSSIGVKGNSKQAGSLGGWVLLNLPQEKQAIPCALTCYHVIRSTDNATSIYTDMNGVVRYDPRGQVEVEYPAAYDSQHTMRRLERIYQNYPGDISNDQTYQVLSSRLQSPSIGNVIFASGHRRTADTRLDWALISSPKTFTANKPTPGDAIQPPFELPYNEAYTQNADSKVTQFAQPRLGDWVTKRGRSTGYTTGEVNHMHREVQWPSGETTFEIEILSYTANFSAPGDSGSFVTNVRGELVGMMFAIDCRAGQFDVAFVTPIEVIQDDVKRMTGGFLSLD